MKRLQIFRSGTHTAMSGATLAFSEDELRKSVDAYDPARHEAPIVVGHPKDDAPAYGWISALAFSDGVLEAEPHQVNEQFAELVTKGSFKKISASFYTPNSKHNPVPGVYYLRHVGFLGAQPPAVKGLKSAEFADHEEGVIEFADWGDRAVARLLRGLKNLLLGNASFSKEAVEEALPEWQLETAVEEAVKETTTSSFSETDPGKESTTMKTAEQLKADQDKLAADRAAFEKEKAEFAERNQQLTAKEQEARRNEIAAFADTLIKNGKLLPAHKEGMVAFMATLSADQVVEFGEGDKKQQPKSLDFLQGFLQSLPNQVEFAELGKGGDAPPADKHEDFGESVDEDRLDLHRRAKHIQKTESVSYSEALAKARNQE